MHETPGKAGTHRPLTHLRGCGPASEPELHLPALEALDPPHKDGHVSCRRRGGSGRALLCSQSLALADALPARDRAHHCRLPASIRLPRLRVDAHRQLRRAQPEGEVMLRIRGFTPHRPQLQQV
eukprot:scaffold8005_cov118-Isochrysis_galbana.AAC.13